MRKTETVVAPQHCGRDAGKHFRITEWPAATAEAWAIRALLAFNRGGTDFPGADALVGHGMAGVVAIGVQSFLRGRIQGDEAVPILNELLECVAMVRDPNARTETGDPVVTKLLETDIEEVQTRMWLRAEVLRLHTGFSMADALSRLISAIMAAPASSNTSTSLR